MTVVVAPPPQPEAVEKKVEKGAGLLHEHKQLAVARTERRSGVHSLRASVRSENRRCLPTPPD